MPAFFMLHVFSQVHAQNIQCTPRLQQNFYQFLAISPKLPNVYDGELYCIDQQNLARLHTQTSVPKKAQQKSFLLSDHIALPTFGSSLRLLNETRPVYMVAKMKTFLLCFLRRWSLGVKSRKVLLINIE